MNKIAFLRGYTQNRRTPPPPSLENTIRQVLKDQTGLHPSKLTDLNVPYSSLGMDELDNIEYIMGLEEALTTSIPDKVCEKWKTPMDTLNYFKRGIPLPELKIERIPKQASSDSPKATLPRPAVRERLAEWTDWGLPTAGGLAGAGIGGTLGYLLEPRAPTTLGGGFLGGLSGGVLGDRMAQKMYRERALPEYKRIVSKIRLGKATPQDVSDYIQMRAIDKVHTLDKESSIDAANKSDSGYNAVPGETVHRNTFVERDRTHQSESPNEAEKHEHPYSGITLDEVMKLNAGPVDSFSKAGAENKGNPFSSGDYGFSHSTTPAGKNYMSISADTSKQPAPQTQPKPWGNDLKGLQQYMHVMSGAPEQPKSWAGRTFENTVASAASPVLDMFNTSEPKGSVW